MNDRFVVDTTTVRGRAGIYDRDNGNRLVGFFLAVPANPNAATRMASVCADALNAAVTRRQGGNHETR